MKKFIQLYKEAIIDLICKFCFINLNFLNNSKINIRKSMNEKKVGY